MGVILKRAEVEWGGIGGGKMQVRHGFPGARLMKANQHMQGYKEEESL